jgi:hypothetical protein
VDGQFSFRAADGSVRTLAYVRGVIESVNNGTSIVVQAADGSSWAWQLVSTTVVRDGTGKISESSLAAGEQVWVGGPVVSGVKDARLIFVRPPQWVTRAPACPPPAARPREAVAWAAPRSA